MRNLKRLASVLLLIVLVTFLALLVFDRQGLTDWWRLRNYSPPAAVVSLADQDTMTDMARKFFYVNKPELTNDVNQFHKQCPDSEKTIVLGCYHPNQQGITIYNVSDARLHGVQQVTAAHEMLHAAYDRLSDKEKTHIDGLLQNYYTHDLHDQRLLKTIDGYKETEPDHVVDEMHSVFGTEATNLPPQLENYYQQYFKNRSAVTSFAAGYEQEFTSRIAQINQYDQQLANLRAQIGSEEQSLKNQSNQIDTERARLESLKASGQNSAYNSGVPAFNAAVNSYNSGVRQLQSDIARYNQLVDQRNSIALELRSLDSALDTRLTTQPAQQR